MSREASVAVVESFLNCLVTNDLARIPVDPNFTTESPLISRRSGPAAMEALKLVAAGLKGVRILQHIVEGNYVATLFEEETVNGSLTVFTKFELEADRIRDVRVFYDPRELTGSK